MMQYLNNKNLNDRPIDVYVKRGKSIESVHRVHASVSDLKGRQLMSAGNGQYETFIRSALKPFQVLPFINSGTYEAFKASNRTLSLACGSHSGTPEHAREAFKLLWNSKIDVKNLKCPIPLNQNSNLLHNCSGKHAAFLATCKKMGWPLRDYLSKSHPLQKEIIRRISCLLGIPAEELITERDDCGAPTLLLTIAQMSLLYANLSSSSYPEFEKITRAMIECPDLVGGQGRFDTELIKRGHGQIISKGGAEGIQCLGRIGEGLGLSIKVEDGSKRAKHAVAIHLMQQLEWMTPTALSELKEITLPSQEGVYIDVQGKLKIP